MGGLFWQTFNVLKELVNRLIKLPDFLLALAGVLPDKKVRLRIVILRDERGLPVTGNEEVLPAYEEARRVLARSARVIVEPAGWQVVTAPHAASPAALDVHCTDGAWQDDLGEAGTFFRSLMAKTPFGTVTGYGAPVTVFIVRSISTHNGCSLGVLTDYVVVEAKNLRNTRRLLVHEVSHTCGLWHTDDIRNLMMPKDPGEHLTRWQAAILRSSRHVTYL
ncbi:MAG: hypothetical protein R6X18_02685 [Chloroflexota bacterium]|jgi:hypothetical protein